MNNFFIILFFNCVIFFNFKKISLVINIFDKPGSFRKIHNVKTPLLGGFVFLINIFFLFLLEKFDENLFPAANSFEIIFFLFGCTFFCMIGFIDDKYNLHANTKLLSASAFLLLFLQLDPNLILNEIKFSFYNNPIHLGIFSIPFTILCFLLFINAFNMIDGINLLAISYFLFFLIFLLIHGYSYKFITFLFFPSILFLIKNYNGKTFLGDNGSLLIGFIIAYLCVKFYNSSWIFQSADHVFLTMMIPGLDLLRLSVQRILQKRHPFSSDRLHLHHLLLNFYSNQKTLFLLLSFILVPVIIDYITNNNFTIFVILVSSIFYFGSVGILSLFKK